MKKSKRSSRAAGGEGAIDRRDPAADLLGLLVIDRHHQRGPDRALQLHRGLPQSGAAAAPARHEPGDRRPEGARDPGEADEEDRKDREIEIATGLACQNAANTSVAVPALSKIRASRSDVRRERARCRPATGGYELKMLPCPNDRRTGPPDQPGEPNQEITRRPTLERLGGEHSRILLGCRFGGEPNHFWGGPSWLYIFTHRQLRPANPAHPLVPSGR